MLYIKLKTYQSTAASDLVTKYRNYRYSNGIKDDSGEFIPIILALASITGSGKTPMLAKPSLILKPTTVLELFPSLYGLVTIKS